MSVVPLHPTASQARTVPHDLQAEQSLLGAMLLSKDAIEVGAETLTRDDFYKPAHADIFDAIVTLHIAGQPADPVTVADELARADLLERVGGRRVLSDLQADTPSTTSAGRYARIVKDHALMRALAHVAVELSDMAYSRPSDVQVALDDAETAVFNLAQHHVSDTMHTTDESMNDLIDLLEQRCESNGVCGVPTGMADIDDCLNGLQPGALYIVGARPSMGKTAFAMSIIRHVTVECGTPTLLVSLEMSHTDITQRLVSMQARVNANNLRSGQIPPVDWQKISHAIPKLTDAPLMIDDNPAQTIMGIRAKARRMKARGGLGLIVVDYVQLMTGRTSAESRQVEVSEISRGLKVLAREMGCPVIALSQLSRGLEMRGDKRPMLADLRESGAIEQDADVVMFIYRDEVYTPDSPDRGTAEIIVAKHRNGPTGVSRVAFVPNYTLFANMARGM